jgi:hypothetical protein
MIVSKRLTVLFAGVLAIGLVAAGCGSSDDGGGVTTSSLTKAQFIEQADTICDRAGDEIEAEVESYANENGIDVNREPTDEQKEEIVVEVIVPNVEGQAEEIAALGAPSGEEDQVGEIVETAAAETADDPGPVINGKEGAFADVNKLAQDFGLTACGEG